MTAAPVATELGAAELALCRRAGELLGTLGRADLAARVQTAGARLARSATLICVVGEFKQGKSSLVNAMVGEHLCPVDDDLATSVITVLHHGDTAQTVVHRREGDRKVAEIVDGALLSAYVSEQGNPANALGIDRVDVALPNPLLARGLMLVDTPGMGGLGAGHAAATLAFLPYADALLFVSDASAELSAPEIEFLRRAVGHCPTVVCCLTKTDLHPDWRRVRELDLGHLRSAGVDAEVVALSATLRAHALARADRTLNEESGYPELLRLVHEEVLDEARVSNAARATHEVSATLGQVRAADEAELAMLRDPSTVAGAVVELERTKAVLEHLRGPAARWNVLLADRAASLGAEVNHSFRRAMRTVLREFEEQVDELRTASQWDRAARDIQRDVAVAVAEVFQSLVDGGAAIQSEIRGLLREEADGPDVDEFVTGLDPTTLWRELPRELQPGAGRRVSTGLGQAFDGLRGAQGGVMVLALLHTVLPAAAGAVILTNPFLLGFGLFSGGRTVLEGRRRRLSAQRQKLRASVRQFADTVGFEVGNELSTSLRTLQQQLRNHFTARMEELSRTATELARQAQANANLVGPAAAERAAVLERRIAAIENLLPGVVTP